MFFMQNSCLTYFAIDRIICTLKLACLNFANIDLLFLTHVLCADVFQPKLRSILQSLFLIEQKKMGKRLIDLGCCLELFRISTANLLKHTICINQCDHLAPEFTAEKLTILIVILPQFCRTVLVYKTAV